MQSSLATDSHPRLKGLDQFLESEASDWLKEIEQFRRAAFIDIAIAGALAALFGAAAAYAWHALAFFDFILLFIATIIVVAWVWFGMWRFSRARKAATRLIWEKTCSFLAMTYSASPSKTRFENFKSLYLLPIFTTRWVNHEIAGEFDGIEFHLIGAMVTLQVGRSSVIDFSGQLVTFRVRQSVSGITICSSLFQDRGWLARVSAGGANKPPDTVERIEIGDPAFDDVFEVYGENETETRRLLDKEMRGRLMAISNAVGEINFALAFREDEVFVSINRGQDPFEIGIAWPKLDNPGRLQAIVNNIGYVIGIAKALRLNERVAA